ncbi:MAG: ATP-binding protein [Fibrobacteria bacterium]
MCLAACWGFFSASAMLALFCLWGWIRSAIKANSQSGLLKDAQARIVVLETHLASVRNEADQYIQTAAHDMQAPLRHVAGFVQILSGEMKKEDGEKAPGNGAESEKYFEYILAGTRRMTDMVSGLVEWGRIGKAEIPDSLVDMNLLFENALKAIRPELAMIEGIGEIAGSLPAVRGSRSLLEKIAAALLQNCIRYRCPDRLLRISIQPFAGREGTGFRLVDNGLGIEAEKREKVFQPFQRLHAYDKINGSGMGLTLARKIVERHQGRIFLEDGMQGGLAVVAAFGNHNSAPPLR